MLKLLAAASVEGNPGCVATLRRHRYLSYVQLSYKKPPPLIFSFSFPFFLSFFLSFFIFFIFRLRSSPRFQYSCIFDHGGDWLCTKIRTISMSHSSFIGLHQRAIGYVWLLVHVIQKCENKKIVKGFVENAKKNVLSISFFCVCCCVCCFTLSSTPAGTTIGRNDNEWGQIGVTIMAGTLGWIMDAPAATAYAVDPVGVETIKPERIINQNHSN